MFIKHAHSFYIIFVNFSMRFILSILFLSVCYATVINVPSDQSTIQLGLTAASEGDTVLVQPDTYYENILWPETNGIKLISAGDSSNTVIDGGAISSVIYMNPQTATIDTTTEIQGFKITNGGNENITSGGGMIIVNGGANIVECSITNNISQEKGGGIYIQQSISNIYKSNISNNNTAFVSEYYNGGGGIYIACSTVKLFEVTVDNNRAEEHRGGGGIFCSSGETQCDANLNFSIINSIISNNYAGDEAGGIFFSGMDTVILTNVDIYDNTAVGYAGGLFLNSATSMQFNSVNITNNTAENGGGLRSSGVDLIGDINIINNTAQNSGGGIWLQGEVNIKNIPIIGNNASKGGAIYIFSSSSQIVNIDSSIISGNMTTSGSTIENYEYAAESTLNILNSIISNNVAENAGILYSDELYVNISKSTLYNNFSEGIYKGIILDSGSSLTMSNSNIYNNGNSVQNNEILSFSTVYNNYWGNSSGPYHPSQNSTGEGDSTNSFVNVTPWLTAPNTDAPPIPPQSLAVTGNSDVSVDLNWDASLMGDLAGYKVYYDTDSGYPYANSVDVGTSIPYTLSNLSHINTYYVAVTAYDTDGNESWYSNELVSYSGCTTYTACNYDPDAFFDDGSCTYAEENYDCSGDCIIVGEYCDDPLDPNYCLEDEDECACIKSWMESDPIDKLVCYYLGYPTYPPNGYNIEKYNGDACDNQYVTPTTYELEGFRCQIQTFLNNPSSYTANNNACSASLIDLGYNIHTFENDLNNASYTIFTEIDNIINGVFQKGWGTYVFNHDAKWDNLIIEVNHPVADKSTEWIGANVFDDNSASWLFIAGAHRYACVIGSDCIEDKNCGADMAREENSVFQVFHEEVTNHYSGTINALSIHGFSNNEYDTYVYNDEVGIVLSHGDDLNGNFLAPSTLAQMLIGQFNDKIPTEHYHQPAITSFDAFNYNYLNICDSLGGTLNPQGTYTNTNYPDLDDRWIHVEADSNIRESDGQGGFRNEYYEAIIVAVSDYYESTNLNDYGCDDDDIYDTGACNLVYCDGSSDNSGIIYDDSVCACGGTAEADCAGECDGTAFIDECGDCVPGGDTSCEIDCAGTPNGTNWVSDCGCVAVDNSGDDCDDCSGTPNGDAVVDNCGACDSDSSNDCVQDCAGTWGGSLEDDACGNCGGDCYDPAEAPKSREAFVYCSSIEDEPNNLIIADECGVCAGDGPDEGFDCEGNELSIYNDLVPKEYKIHTIYPNPFNPSTNISFSIPEFGLTTIIAYDMQGKKMETLTNKVLPVGNYSIQWNASNYTSGVYLIRMESGDFIQTQKVVLVK